MRKSAAEEVFSARRARRRARLLRALTLIHAARVRGAIDLTLAAALPLAAVASAPGVSKPCRTTYPQWRWHLDEAFVKLNGKLWYLWRAVDHEGEVLEAVVTAKRDKAAALKFLKRFSVLASSRTCSREGRIWLTSPA